MKTVKEERLVIHLVLTRDGGIGQLEVSGQADYEVASDGLTEGRSIDLDLTTAQENAIKSFAGQVLNKIKQQEN